MCGRYQIETDPRTWLNVFDALRDCLPDVTFQPRYNVAPSQAVPVIRAAGDHWDLVEMRWGYVPGFVREEKPRLQPINARGDRLATSGYYRHSFRQRRCLLPATGFYEWRRRGGGKQPWHIQLPGRSPLLFGGIWDNWRGTDTVAIITTEPNSVLGRLHDRMPLILPPERASAWLTGERPEALIVPYATELEAWPVSTRVNSPANDGPQLLQPVDEE